MKTIPSRDILLGLFEYDPTRGGKWEARICSGRARVSLGAYDTPELASEAYRAAKKTLHSFQPVQRMTNLYPRDTGEKT